MGSYMMAVAEYACLLEPDRRVSPESHGGCQQRKTCQQSSATKVLQL